MQWLVLIALTGLVRAAPSIPEVYNLTIRPNFENLTYTGKLALQLWTPEVRHLDLASEGLQVSEVNVMASCSYELESIWSLVQGRLIVSLVSNKNSFKEGSHCLDITFKGNITKTPTGFYAAPYQYQNTTRWVLATQLEPNYTKSVFPCVDDTSQLVKFILAVELPQGYTAVSHAPPIVKDAEEGLMRFEFGQQRYRVEQAGWAVVGPGYKESAPGTWNQDMPSTTPFRASPSGATTIVLPQTPRLPSYTPGLILVSNGEDIWRQKQEVTRQGLLAKYVLPQKMVHRWIYNALARYSVLKEGGCPRYEMDQYDVLNLPQVVSPLHLEYLLDTESSYAKGAALFRMLNYNLGSSSPGPLDQILTTQNLPGTEVEIKESVWDRLKPSKNETYTDVWIMSEGFPVINVMKKNNIIEITQRHINNKTQAGEWWIPFVYVSISNSTTETKSAMLLPKQKLKIELKSANDFFFINPNGTGLYRMNYEWDLEWFNLGKEGRAQLVSDALGLARAGHIPYSRALHLVTQLLTNETDPLVKAAALPGFAYISNILFWSPNLKLWQNYALNLLGSPGNIYTSADPHALAIMGASCSMYKSETCREKALAIFPDLLQSNKTNITSEMRASLLCTVIGADNDTYWTQVFHSYVNATTQTEKNIFLKALACTRRSKSLSSLLKMLLVENFNSTSQDLMNSVSLMAETPLGAHMVFHFLEGNYNKVVRITGDELALMKILSKVCSLIIKEKHMEETKRFIKRPALGIPDSFVQDLLLRTEREFVQKVRTMKEVEHILRPDLPEEQLEVTSHGSQSSRLNFVLFFINLILFLYYIKH